MRVQMAYLLPKKLKDLKKQLSQFAKDIVSLARKVLRMVRAENSPAKIRLSQWISGNIKENFDRYSSHLHSESAKSALKIQAIPPEYDQEIAMEDGRIILRDNYRKLLEKFPELLVFGEDAGKIGGVNQTLEGLQDQFGDLTGF
jgi:Pyruvate/2-oxoglutarate dehydrogenase complex, dehydrogenase (E1) component, eukaryotic type, beta subunit